LLQERAKFNKLFKDEEAASQAFMKMESADNVTKAKVAHPSTRAPLTVCRSTLHPSLYTPPPALPPPSFASTTTNTTTTTTAAPTWTTELGKGAKGLAEASTGVVGWRASQCCLEASAIVSLYICHVDQVAALLLNRC
jgi:hypothetical protein